MNPDPPRPIPPEFHGRQPTSVPATPSSAQPTATPGTQSNRGGRSWAIGLLAVAAAATAGVLYQFVGTATESNHTNWPQVREASSRPPGEIRWQNRDGTIQNMAGFPLADEDEDKTTTASVKAALEANDDAKAEEIVRTAQNLTPAVVTATPAIPEATPAPPPPPAPVTEAAPVISLTPGMKTEIRKGDTRFFHIFLYDCCDEDGDVVEVLIDGVPFSTVTLSNQGMTLSVPVAADGSTKIQIRGVYDGGGGITVACRTSKGQGFLRAMPVGGVETLAVIRK